MDIMIISEKWATDLAEFCELVKKGQSGASTPPPTHIVYGLLPAAALSQ